jgi:hypothetical protein
MEFIGKPFNDSVFLDDLQVILGRILCAYYDNGGNGVACYDSAPLNHGSGELNPANESYIHEFRMIEGPDTANTKDDEIDDSPYN